MSLPARCPARSFTVDRSVGELWTEFAAITPAAHSYKEVCSPKYFGPMRTKKPRSPRATDNGLRIGDIIRVRAEDHLWMAEFVVREIPDGMDEVYTDELRLITFGADKVPDGYTLTYRGTRGWCIDLQGEHIEGGFATEESANNRVKWYEENQKIQNKIATVSAAARAKTVSKTKTKAKAEAETADAEA